MAGIALFHSNAFAFSGGSRSARLVGTNSAERSPQQVNFRNSSNPCSDNGLTARVPRGGQSSGSSIAQSLSQSGGNSRHCSILENMSSGNIPDHLRNLVPVRMGEVTICVMPDYMSFGTDSDSVRAPLGRDQAVELARDMGFMLPTNQMVDQICAQSNVRLSPSPMTPGPSMTSTDYFVRHDSTIDRQVAQAGGRPGQLTGCHKKDLVSNGAGNPSALPFYGWHRSNGSPIQNFSTGAHGSSYADYSHGVRLVSQVAFVNGQPVSLSSLLSNPAYQQSLS